MAIDYRGLGFGQQWFPEEQVDEAVTDVTYPNKPFLYGDLNPYRSETEKFKTRFDPTQIQAAPEKRGFNFDLSGIAGPVTGGLKWLGEKFKRPEAKQTAYDAITGSLDDRGYGTYKGNQYRFGESPSGLKVYSEVNPFGKNFDSAFGSKSLEEMDQKTLDWALNRVKNNKAISTRLRNILESRGMLGDTRGVTADAPEFITQRGQPAAPVTTGGGGTFDPAMDPRGRRDPTPSWHGATAARGRAEEQVAGPGFGRGAYWAEGGRVGYQDGELVEDEYMAEATPRGMMEENIEEVQGEPTREQLEVIALEIFRLPLEELNEEQLEVVYQAAMEQEPSEEEVQFAAQEGPGEGIASLV